MLRRKNENQLEIEFFRIELRRCTNSGCEKLFPLCMFSKNTVHGKEYRRGWCKFCEASRERRRHTDRRVHGSKEERDVATVASMMRRFLRPAQNDGTEEMA